VKRVDDQVGIMGRAHRTAHEEVAREIDTFGLDAGPTGDFHVDERERDRDAGTAIEHLIEEGIARVLVVGRVADEALFPEQVVVQRLDTRVGFGIDARRCFARRTGDGDAQRGIAAHRVELVDIRSGVEVRVLEPRDHQRGDRQIRIRTERDTREAHHGLLGYHAFRIQRRVRKNGRG
jgi:hypothetical protein